MSVFLRLLNGDVSTAISQRKTIVIDATVALFVLDARKPLAFPKTFASFIAASYLSRHERMFPIILFIIFGYISKDNIHTTIFKHYYHLHHFHFQIILSFVTLAPPSDHDALTHPSAREKSLI